MEINNFGCAEIRSKNFIQSVGFRCIVVSDLFFSLFLQIFVSKNSMLNFEYLKSHFLAGCLEFSLLMKSNNYVLLLLRYIIGKSTIKIYIYITAIFDFLKDLRRILVIFIPFSVWNHSMKTSPSLKD